MVYTPFHGTGYKLIPEALKRLGMKHVICVPEQMVIDGNFPTVVSPCLLYTSSPPAMAPIPVRRT